MSDWRPIETAPRNGTDIIVYRPKFDGTYIPQVGIDWFSKRLGGVWAKSRHDVPPMHWMPLPEPPKNCLKSDTAATPQIDKSRAYRKVPGLGKAPPHFRNARKIKQYQ